MRVAFVTVKGAIVFVTRIEVFDLCSDRIKSKKQKLFDPKTAVENSLLGQNIAEIKVETCSNTNSIHGRTQNRNCSKYSQTVRAIPRH